MDKIIKNTFKKLSNIAEKDNIYVDFNYINKNNKTINIDKINTNISRNKDEGIKLRIFNGYNFTEYAQSKINYNILEEKFLELLNSVKQKQLIIEKELNIDRQIIEKDYTTKNYNNEEISLKEEIDMLNDIKQNILNYDENIVNIRVSIQHRNEKYIFVNKYKQLSQKIKLYVISVFVFVKCNDGIVRETHKIFSGNDLSIINKLQSNLDKVKKNINNIKKSKKLPGGKYKVILSSKLSGLLAHESFGHGMEADTIIKKRALAKNYFNTKISNSNVNIVDNPKSPGSWGELFFDQEGKIGKETYLVKDGIINQPMSDMFSTQKEKFKITANSRFENFDHKNYVRMTNTYFKNGEENFEDLLKKVDDGIFIIDSSGGMEDPKSWGVQIQGNFGQRIKNGKLIDEFYEGFTLTGFLLDIMKNITGISNRFKLEGVGFCGKGHKEWVRVSEGGPDLLIDEVILG